MSIDIPTYFKELSNIIMKGEIMSDEIKKELPVVKLSDTLEVVLEVAKPDERFIITKTDKGQKLFYKMHRRACSSSLSRGTHFKDYQTAKDHFESYIKNNWKHTKKFKIEPISNYFISDWSLNADSSGMYYPTYNLGPNNKLFLRNRPISIDDIKRGKKVTTVKELLEKVIKENDTYEKYSKDAIEKRKKEIENLQFQILKEENDRCLRAIRINDLKDAETVLETLINENTSKAEETVLLFYGKE